MTGDKGAGMRLSPAVTVVPEAVTGPVTSRLSPPLRVEKNELHNDGEQAWIVFDRELSCRGPLMSAGAAGSVHVTTPYSCSLPRISSPSSVEITSTLLCSPSCESARFTDTGRCAR